MSKLVKPGSTAIYPTPVVLVTSVDAHGKPNIITLAWTGIVCSEPPMVSISIRPSRYSHNLIVSSGQFVVNMPTEDILEETDYCGIVSGRDVDKFAQTGLTPQPATQVKPPLIQECPVNLECLVRQVINLGTHDMIIGEVVATHVNEEIVKAPSGILTTRMIAYSPLTAEYLGIRDVIGKFGFSSR
jgi:flavin reductase (DIM6/NTAB) family NADH-FMN oxidoreductase RutF